MAKAPPSARILVDKDHEDFIADIPGGQVGAIAVAEQLVRMLADENIPPHEHLQGILSRAKHLSASRDGRGRDDLVEVNRAQRDQRFPIEYGMAPRIDQNDGQPAEAMGEPRKG